MTEWIWGPDETHHWTQADLDRFHEVAIVLGDEAGRAKFGLGPAQPGVLAIDPDLAERRGA